MKLVIKTCSMIKAPKNKKTISFATSHRGNQIQDAEIHVLVRSFVAQPDLLIRDDRRGRAVRDGGLEGRIIHITINSSLFVPTSNVRRCV